MLGVMPIFGVMVSGIPCRGNHREDVINTDEELKCVELHLRVMGHHLPFTCYRTQVNTPRLTQIKQAGTLFTYPGRIEG